MLQYTNSYKNTVWIDGNKLKFYPISHPLVKERLGKGEKIKAYPEQLDGLKEEKIIELKKIRDSKFKELIHYKDGLYLKPHPQVNIFLAAYSMADSESKEWYVCDSEGNKLEESVMIGKEDLVKIANEYEERKTKYYNLCNKAAFKLKAFTKKSEIEAFKPEKEFKE